MNYGNIHSWSVNLDRRIALALRRDPKLLGVFEHRLRSKMATARSAAAVGDDDWEWYVILTLWSPLQVIRLLEDSSEQATRLQKTSPLLYLLSDSERRQMICDEVRRMLGAYVDKELELTRQPDLEKHLAGCPSCQAAAEEINNFSSLIRMNILVYKAPVELKAKIQASL